MNRFIIGELLDNDTRERSIELGYAVGRMCDIVQLEIGESMVIQYPIGTWFYSDIVKEIDETDYGVWVKTEKRTYRFDDAY